MVSTSYTAQHSNKERRLKYVKLNCWRSQSNLLIKEAKLILKNTALGWYERKPEYILEIEMNRIYLSVGTFSKW